MMESNRHLNRHVTRCGTCRRWVPFPGDEPHSAEGPNLTFSPRLASLRTWNC